ncbi:hypothetical protein HMPREF1551_01970 [Capnocytophaga sp. oral taxon 863 str. F0517]|nr:hypothetical protein HMPREF1551_01970 [Capnocytophaga sp. oral taxon 863 str. F0517]
MFFRIVFIKIKLKINNYSLSLLLLCTSLVTNSVQRYEKNSKNSLFIKE